MTDANDLLGADYPSKRRVDRTPDYGDPNRVKALSNPTQQMGRSNQCAFFLMENHTVRGVGPGAELAMGATSFTPQSSPAVVPMPIGLVGTPIEVHQSVSNYAVLTDEGDIATWGNAIAVGDGQNSVARNIPVLIDATNIGPRSGISGRKVKYLTHSGTTTFTDHAWCAICEDGTAWAWGDNSPGICAAGAGVFTDQASPNRMQVEGGGFPDVKFVEAYGGGGAFSSNFYLIDEHRKAWFSGEVSLGSHGFHAGVAADIGYLRPVGTASTTPNGGGTNLLPDDYRAKSVKMGNEESTGNTVQLLTEDGRLFRTGNAQFGNGDGSSTNSGFWREIVNPDGLAWVDHWVGPGYCPSFATDAEGNFYGWGNGNGGQIPDNGNTNRTTAVKITTGGDRPWIVKLVVGGEYNAAYYHTWAALTADGRVFGWGVYGGYVAGLDAQSNVMLAARFPWVDPARGSTFATSPADNDNTHGLRPRIPLTNSRTQPHIVDIWGGSISSNGHFYALTNTGEVYTWGRNPDRMALNTNSGRLVRPHKLAFA